MHPSCYMYGNRNVPPPNDRSDQSITAEAKEVRGPRRNTRESFYSFNLSQIKRRGVRLTTVRGSRRGGSHGDPRVFTQPKVVGLPVRAPPLLVIRGRTTAAHRFRECGGCARYSPGDRGEVESKKPKKRSDDTGTRRRDRQKERRGSRGGLLALSRLCPSPFCFPSSLPSCVEVFRRLVCPSSSLVRPSSLVP